MSKKRHRMMLSLSENSATVLSEFSSATGFSAPGFITSLIETTLPTIHLFLSQRKESKPPGENGPPGGQARRSRANCLRLIND